MPFVSYKFSSNTVVNQHDLDIEEIISGIGKENREKYDEPVVSRVFDRVLLFCCCCFKLGFWINIKTEFT